MERERANHRVATLCRVLGVSTSGYYAWRQRGICARAREDSRLAGRIKKIHSESRGTYGAPRIHAELRLGDQVRCSKKRVARLMREAGLTGVHRRRKTGCTRQDPQKKAYPDLVGRDFRTSAPDQLWVADITPHRTAEGWHYLAVILDAFSRMAVGWAMGDRPTSDLVVEAVNMAIETRQPETGLIHHSDHGAQYTSLAFSHRLQEAGITGSMGSVGSALDNALAESFFGTLQTELLDRDSWPTRRKLCSEIFWFIEGFYNRTRRHSALEYRSPAEYERIYWDRQITAITPNICHSA